ncbi:MAG: VTT domain-containing protein [Firmicutes bacterium]|nr:VTT domain-containing protein [Bacillota bacterium]
MAEKKNTASYERFLHAARIGCLLLICAVLALLFVISRDKLTVEQLLLYTPSAPLAAAAVMLGLFGLKSFCMFLYCGLLYAACGVLFPLPGALAVNLAGTVIMITLPYLLGRRSGGAALERMVEKHPKLSLFMEFKDENPWFLSLFMRLASVLPSDLISIFLGAGGIPYGKYLLGSVLGMLPTIVAFTVMGMSVRDVTSPAFLIALGAEAALVVLSAALYALLHRRKQRRTACLRPAAD